MSYAERPDTTHKTPMDVKIAPDWKELLAPEFEKPYFARLVDFVRSEYAAHRIFRAAATSSAHSTNARSTA